MTTTSDRVTMPLLALGAIVLTAVGLSGVGDAPAPHEPASAMAAHFSDVGDAVLVSAPLGTLGAVALGAFLLTLARRLHADGQSVAAAIVVGGGLLAVGYLIVLHIVYALLAYSIAATSADVTKGLFVGTIVATTVYGLGVALVLVGAAWGAARAGLLPVWWSAVSGAGGAVAAIALFSFAASGFFSPDVQQQVVAGVIQLWLLVTAVTVATAGGSTRRHLGSRRE